jgi:hypothetical protein
MYSTDGHGNMKLLKTDPTWRKSWSIVKPCQISSGSFSDLMFYDPGAGVGEFYSTDGHGNMNLLNSDPSWRNTWSIILPANFVSGPANDLLFYDPGAGTGEFYTTSGNAVSTAILSTCEADYSALEEFFGMSSHHLPFSVLIQPGENGASHGSCGDQQLYIDAFDGTDQDR